MEEEREDKGMAASESNCYLQKFKGRVQTLKKRGEKRKDFEGAKLSCFAADILGRKALLAGSLSLYFLSKEKIVESYICFRPANQLLSALPRRLGEPQSTT